MSLQPFERPLDHGGPERDVSPQQVAHRTDREQLHLRNYDQAAGYDLNIRLRRDGRCAVDQRLYLQPGGIRCLGKLVPPGEWQVVVSLSGKQPTRERCSLGPSIAQTVVIECGNGVVAVNERGP
jgi:hypothetical protein